MVDNEGIWSRGGVNVEELPDPFAPEPPAEQPQPTEEKPKRRRWVIVLYAVSAVLLVTLRGVNPASMAIFDTPGGQLVLVGCALLEGIGYLWMLRAAAVRREERLFAGDAPGVGRSTTPG